jgi:large subunit ribosomal protein L9
MKILLLKDVKGQGRAGQIIDVSDGYARNFLIPQKLGSIADNGTLAAVKSKEAAAARKIELDKAAARELAAKLEAYQVKIPMTSGGDERLYGSVTSKDIAEKLAEQTGIVVDKKKIDLAEPIKAYGSYTAEVTLYTGITGKINVLVCK